MKNLLKVTLAIMILIQFATIQAANADSARSRMKGVTLHAGNWCYGVDGQVPDSDSDGDGALDKVLAGSTVIVSITARGKNGDCDDKNDELKTGSIIKPQDRPTDFDLKRGFVNDSSLVDASYEIEMVTGKGSERVNLVSEVSAISLLRQVSQESAKSKIIRIVKDTLFTVTASEKKKIYVGNLPFSATRAVLLLPAEIQDQVNHYARSNNVVVVIRHSQKLDTLLNLIR